MSFQPRSGRRGTGLVASLLLGMLLSIPLAAPMAHAQAGDADGDGVMDAFDNCVSVPNADQADANAGQDDDASLPGVQHYGDVCDADLDDDGLVGASDFFSVLRPCIGADLGSEPQCGVADLDGDGAVGPSDFFSVFRPALGSPPGPGVTEAGLAFGGLACDDTTPGSECVITVQTLSFVTTRQRISSLPPTAPEPGIVVMDDIIVPTPFGDVSLAEAILTFTVGTGSPLGPFQTVVGTARVPFPDIGFLAGAQVDQTPMATVGLDLGANIDLGVPLQPDLHYLFFQFGTDFNASLGPISFAVGGPGATLVLDPFDPFLFVGGSLAGLIPGTGSESPSPDSGFGFSLGGNIPFVPDRLCTTCEHDFRDTGVALDSSCDPCVAQVCAQDAACCSSAWDQSCVAAVPVVCSDPAPGSFDGSLLLKGEVPLGTLPLSLNGTTIGSIDPKQDGTIFQGSPDLALGANSTLSVGVPFLSFFSFGFDLGDATASVEFDVTDSMACFNGVLDPQDPFAMFPPEFPIPIRQNPGQAGAEVIGSFSAPDLASSFISANGEFSIDLGPLGAPIGVNLGTLASTAVDLRIDSTGLRFAGMTQSQVIPNFTNTEMSLDVRIPTDDPLQTSAELAGALTIAGLGLDPARMFISPGQGFEVEGTLDLAPVAVLMVTGDVGASGVLLNGSFDSDISFDLNMTVDDVLAEAQMAVDFAQAALDACKATCTGDCYANACCIACDAALLAPVTAAQAALDVAEAAALAFFGALPFPLAGTITTDVDVTIRDLNASGAVSAQFAGLTLGGRLVFVPPQVCITLPLGIYPGAGDLGLGDTEFCLPPS